MFAFVVVSSLIVSQVLAACGGTTCSSCKGENGCTWCVASGFNICAETSSVGFYNCISTVGAADTCPDPCLQGVTTAKRCNVGANYKAQSGATCGYVNSPPTAAPASSSTGTTGTTAVESECERTRRTEPVTNQACALASASLSCSYSCQVCTDGGPLLKLCSNTCDSLKSACPLTTAKCTGENDIFATICSNTTTNCASVKIDYVFDSQPGTPAAGTSAPGTTTAPAVGTSAQSAPASSLGTPAAETTVPSLDGGNITTTESNATDTISTAAPAVACTTAECCAAFDSDADKQPCTKCSENSGCKYFATFNNNVFVLGGKCLLADAEAPTATRVVNSTSECIDFCSQRDCATCQGSAADGCVWCDSIFATTGKIGKGSCDVKSCTLGTKPVTDAKACSSASSLVVAACAALIALVATML